MEKQITRETFELVFKLYGLEKLQTWACRENSVILKNKEFIIDDRSNEDMITFEKKLSEMIKYYNLSNSESGTWSKFLSDIDEQAVAKLIDGIKQGYLVSDTKQRLLYNSLSPHQVLLFVFLAILQYPKEQLNSLVGKHLNYYYRECLRLKEIPAVPAKAHVVFTAADGVSQYDLPEGTLLTTSDNSNGKEILYRTDQNLLLTSAQIKEMQTVSSMRDGFVQTTVLDKEQNAFQTNFKTFGGKEGSKVEIGFAITSASLNSSSGIDLLDVTLVFNDAFFNSEKIISCFDFYFTSTTGWMLARPKQQNNSSTNEVTLQFKNINYPVVAPGYDCGLSFANNYPILKAVFNSDNIEDYKLFSSMALARIDLKSEVHNLNNLKISNDLGILNSDYNLIYPFGPEPVRGFSLYLTHPDLMDKKLSNVKIKINWLNLPKNFHDYYHGYLSDEVISNDTFQVKMTQYCGGHVKADDNTESLFQSTYVCVKNDGDEKCVEELLLTSTLPVPSCLTRKTSYESKPQGDPDNPVDYSLYFALTLQQDFYNSEYPIALAELAHGKIGGNASEDTNVINPPYIPMCSEITIDSYIAEENITVTEDNNQFQIFGPCGGEEGGILPKYPQHGSLLIGINALQKGVTLSMLWESGTESDQIENDLEWSYLKNNKWYSFDGKSSSIISDKTNGFQRSGIILFHIPQDIDDDNIIASNGLFWLRVCSKNNYTYVTESITKFINLNSTTVSLDTSISTSKDFSTLNSFSIKRLLNENPNIKQIIQPYKGFGGKSKENRNDFLVRTSNRLKHKKRAINAWDYKWMVLDVFDQIDMVQCFRSLDEAGKVLVYVLVAPEHSANPDYPFASVELKKSIHLYLKNHASSLVKIEVTDAKLQQLECLLEITFKKGCDNDSYKAQLQKALNNRFSPWSTGIISGDLDDKKYVIEITNFLNSLKYIESVISINVQPKH